MEKSVILIMKRRIVARISLGEQQAFLGDIFSWWYRQGLKDFFIYLKAVFIKIADFFSIKLLFKTYFSPWKRDIESMEGMPLEGMLKIMMFNLLARLIGAFVKTIIFFLFLAVFVIFLAIALGLALVWIFLPLVTIALIVYGFYLIF